MQYEDYIDPRIGYPLAMVLWAIVLWIYLRGFVWPKIDAYFERRRYRRKEKHLDRVLAIAVQHGTMSPNEARAYRMVHPQRTNAT